MIQFNGKKGRNTKRIVAIVIIVIVAAMLITTLVGAFATTI